MELLEKYLKIDEAKGDFVVTKKDFLTILQSLWKAETFMDQVIKGNADILDVKHWRNNVREAQKIMNKIMK